MNVEEDEDFMMKKAYPILLLFGSIFLLFSATEAASPKEVEAITKIFYVRPELRNPLDQIQVAEGRLQISVASDLPPNPNAEILECQGYRWLLGGRGRRLGRGAPELFQKFPELQSIELELYSLTSSTESEDGRGKLKKKLDKKRHSFFRITRDQVSQLKVTGDDLKDQLWESDGRCLQLGRSTGLTKEIQW